MRNKKEKTSKLNVYQLKYGQARCHKEWVKGINVNYTNTDVINDKGTSRTNYIFLSTWDKEKAASLEINRYQNIAISKICGKWS